jgi:hypothetical protein
MDYVLLPQISPPSMRRLLPSKPPRTSEKNPNRTRPSIYPQERTSTQERPTYVPATHVPLYLATCCESLPDMSRGEKAA